MNAESRIAALRRRLVDDSYQAMLVTGVSNMRYLTGFDAVFDDMINAACLVTPQITRFYTDRRYAEAASVAAEGSPWVVRVPEESLYIEACDELRADGITELALESSVPYGRFKFISEQFVGSVRMLTHVVEEIRQVKESHELERITADHGQAAGAVHLERAIGCLLYTSPSPRDGLLSRMPSSA